MGRPTPADWPLSPLGKPDPSRLEDERSLVWMFGEVAFYQKGLWESQASEAMLSQGGESWRDA